MTDWRCSHCGLSSSYQGHYMSETASRRSGGAPACPNGGGSRGYGFCCPVGHSCVGTGVPAMAMEVESDLKLLPTRYSVEGVEGVTIELRGDDEWSVIHFGEALNDRGEWEWEPSPSNRSKAFRQRTRFASAEDALGALRKSLEAEDEDPS